MPKNCYSILGVSRSANAETIHSAFRTLARRYHPDTAGVSSPGKFREAVEAYNILRDPAQRRQHDIDLGIAQRTQAVAEPLFNRGSITAHRNHVYSTTAFDDLFAEIMRLIEIEFDFRFRPL